MLQYSVDSVSRDQNQTFSGISLDRVQMENSNSSYQDF